MVPRGRAVCSGRLEWVSVVVFLAGCGNLAARPAGDLGDEVLKAEAPLEDWFVRSRSDDIRRVASVFGISNALVVAGVGNAETSLAHCWSEATWTCQGPWSADCNGPVFAGAYDGPCWQEQGGLGLFQLDYGDYAHTLGAYGHSILSVNGNIAAGTQVILEKVRSCPNTPYFGDVGEVVAWVNRAAPGTAEYDTFMAAMAWCYNGCSPYASGCNFAALKARYRDRTEALLQALGWSYWYPPPLGPDGCTDEARARCNASGCACVNGACSGGFCEGDGCTENRRAQCRRFGCVCVDGECAGGFCEGSGCTARQLTWCADHGCGCVDGRCSGGFCQGNGCTAAKVTSCQGVGCGCSDMTCAGGFCPGTGR